MYAHRAHAWAQGRNWIDESPDLWNTLIGCHRYETTTVTISQHVCSNARNLNLTDWYDCIENTCGFLDPSCYTQITQTYSVFVRRPSDGLFCDDTQVIPGLPGQNIYEARGVNHLQEINATSMQPDEMEEVFNLIWDRQPGDFFHTPDITTGC
jgi:hypothetical protein